MEFPIVLNLTQLREPGKGGNPEVPSWGEKGDRRLKQLEKHKACPHSPPDKDIPDAAGKVAHFAELGHPAQVEQSPLLLRLLSSLAIGPWLGPLELVIDVNPDPETEICFVPKRGPTSSTGAGEKGNAWD